MSEHGHDLVEKLHRKAAQRHPQGTEKELALLEQLHRATAAGLQQQQEGPKSSSNICTAKRWRKLPSNHSPQLC
jgi:hypothetical protein